MGRGFIMTGCVRLRLFGYIFHFFSDNLFEFVHSMLELMDIDCILFKISLIELDSLS
jgi:hypothetical protein